MSSSLRKQFGTHLLGYAHFQADLNPDVVDDHRRISNSMALIKDLAKFALQEGLF